MSIKSLIRTIPDYPKPGIMFRDITSLLNDAQGFRDTVDAFVARYRHHHIDTVVAIEARGFIVGAPIAHQLGTGFVPVRKKGKLPGDTLIHHYDLEYGTDTVEIHRDAIHPGAKVLIADDLIATGGTAEATIRLVEKTGGEIVECCFIVDLPDLRGRARIEGMGHGVFALCEFEGE